MLAAGERFERAVDVNRAAVGTAAAKLDEALHEQNTGSAAFGTLRFAGDEPAAAPVAALDHEEALGGVLLEVEVASVAVAAGQVQGETGEPRDPALLRGALTDLGRTVQELEDATGAAVPEGLLGFRLGAEPHVVSSQTPAMASETFSLSVRSSLEGLVTGSSSVTRDAWTEMRSLIPGRLLLDEAIELGRNFSSATAAMGRLIDRGIRKLQAAIAALCRLFGLRNLDAVRDRLAPLWEKLGGGDLLTRALRTLLRAEQVLAGARAAVGRGHDAARLDKASSALKTLDARFEVAMSRAASLRRALTSVSVLVGGLVPFVPVIEPHHLALSMAGYLVLLAGVVLTAMDYADSGTVLGRVDGVGSVVAELGL